ncbi:CcoQ/FixQ family Cbb3-type cytochrome c oxidase assembly chaperone [Pararhodobacter sp. CCB-MM2]|uniref:CcoQ/FixQ family Cbb3-type cytochrome c oxidase assembly chaperone n=1 Tax=Pararhodobacter sp. CCB-MM2 TaxID=1786003 RepID=UPI00082D4224|nr:CcoQ/FixQ family Cbb3-type cytochrome c oxidase assembly chaperone [Pararhodobacter sp. CCB-MM2]MCA2013160.1 CcoQ/FixQ family Cbb3-type cytochrome c oxidase assembly chaperone [Cereibacter sphaeroides]
METYSLLRAFADSWYLLFMTLFFVGIIAWAWRPGSREVQSEAARSIFRNDDTPARDGASGPAQHLSEGAR